MASSSAVRCRGTANYTEADVGGGSCAGRARIGGAIGAAAEEFAFAVGGDGPLGDVAAGVEN